MKKQLLLIISLFITNNNVSFGQQSLYLPVGIIDNRVDIGDLDVGGDSITVEALITKQTSTGTLNDIVCKHLNTNDCNYFLRSTAFAIRTTSGGSSVTNSIVLCSDTTYHVAGTYDGDSIKYYLNGVEVASVHWTGTLILNNDIAAIGNMWNQNGSYNEQYYGYIDEVRIWNVARTQTEIASNMYNLPNPTTQPGLLAYYQFNGNYNNIQGNTTWNGTPIGAQTSLAVNPLFNGSVSNNFCNPVGIMENVTELIFKIYPNPNLGVFKIEFNKPILKGKIELLNIFGENVFKENILNESKKEINLKNISCGIYLVKVFEIEKYYCKKIIIEHN